MNDVLQGLITAIQTERTDIVQSVISSIRSGVYISKPFSLAEKQNYECTSE